MNDASRPPADIRRRRFGASVRAVVAIALAAAILVVANALSTRLYAHWTTGSVRALSDRTLEVLRAANGVVEATAVFERDHPFRDAARDLLQEFAEAADERSGGLSFRVRAIDVNHDIAEATEAFRRHPGLAANSIVLTYGERSRIVDEYELAGEAGGFDGERACVSALLQIVRPVRMQVRFLAGHGEYDPADRHPVTGASTVGRALAANGFDVRPLVLGPDASAVPADCGVLVVAGPRTMFPQREREILADYLSDGGRLLLLADDALAGGLGPLLEMWGLRLEGSSAPRPSAARRSALSYADHPAVRRMEGVLTVFASPCGVAEAPPPAATTLPPRVTPLVSVEEPDGPPRCVAAASEAARSPRANTRIAVFGDADFVSNSLLGGGLEGNALLFLSTVEWLSGRDRPVVSGDFGGTLDPGIGTGREWHRLGVALALGVPACILAFGLLLYVPLTRRR